MRSVFKMWRGILAKSFLKKQLIIIFAKMRISNQIQKTWTSLNTLLKHYFFLKMGMHNNCDKATI